MLPRPTILSETWSSLGDFTDPALVVPELREQDTAGVVKELSQILHERGCVPDLLSFYNAALNHEFLANTATDCGIAFPHARLHGVAESRFAFGRSARPINWGSRPSQPVEFVFLLAVPATDAAGFLQLLSTLARLGQQESLVAELRSSQSAEQLFQLFQGLRVRHG